jgi:hypothetical protein
MEIKFDLPANEYHAVEACSASLLENLKKDCPAVARYSEFEETTAMEKGTATHLAVLEPSKFDSEVIRVDCSNRSTNIYKDAVKANPSALVLPKKDYEEVLAMRSGIQQSRTARWLLANSIGLEVSFFWEIEEWTDGDGVAHFLENPIKCKARADGVSIIENERTGIIWDLKTTANANPEFFKKTCHNLGYHRKACWYLEAARRYRPDLDWRFVWVALRNKAPHLVSCYEVDASWLDFAANQLLKPIQTYELCSRTGDWFGYGDEIIVAHPENWVLREDN